jgi:hypothetical protein
MLEKTPQQIREDRERQKRIARTEALRSKIRAELEFIALPDEGKLAVKKDLLNFLGIKWDVPLKDQSFVIRLIYYKKKDMLHQNSYLMNYYEEHRHEYAGYRPGIPDRGPVVGACAGRTEHPPDGVYRDVDDGIPSPIFQPDSGIDDDSRKMVPPIPEEHFL